MIAIGILFVICLFVPLGILLLLDEIADFVMSFGEFFK